MTAENIQLRHFPGVMISSTFLDLKDYRNALIDILNRQDLHPVGMDYKPATAVGTVIDSSLNMVRDAAAYICVIGRTYGQTPTDPHHNPYDLSLTELEFNEALDLRRPTLLFIMDDSHPVIENELELDHDKQAKLRRFRERAKQNPDSQANRVYASFNGLDDFKTKAASAVADLRRLLDRCGPGASAGPRTLGDPIPVPPAFYAEPRYIGSHSFLGREDQLSELHSWARPINPHPVLLFDAIGGAGKSMLTWEWTTKHAPRIRKDWAGRFWYSFYERGAIMADFCRHALAYITRRPIEDFERVRTPELAERLIHHLQDRPWLLILDGLERVLVAYHRSDAAQVIDEEVDRPTDLIARRDPCAAIRPEDDDLLHAMAGARPSKIVMTSRLVPRVLLNQVGQPIPGVMRRHLPGLRPADAEELLRSCGIVGSPKSMQTYLRFNCDCHPLVTGALAGLINDYLPDRGSFDAWAADSNAGGRLNLADLTLTQKRNHIMFAALAAVPQAGRELLSTLGLLTGAIDYETLSALNPHLPPEPKKVGEPHNPETDQRWSEKSDEEKLKARNEYDAAVVRRREYEQAVEARLQSREFRIAPQLLSAAVHDLERRGLLQYDCFTRRYDLHPVVRGIVVGKLQLEETVQYGQRVVDYFTEKPHSPYEQASTLEDVQGGMHIVRTLLRMERFKSASYAYQGDLSIALAFNLEAWAEVASLLKPFFASGWGILPNTVDGNRGIQLANNVSDALYNLGHVDESRAAQTAALGGALASKSWEQAVTLLGNLSGQLEHGAQVERCLTLTLELASLVGNQELVFCARLRQFGELAVRGNFDEAQKVWDALEATPKPTTRAYYRPGEAESDHAIYLFWQGQLTLPDLEAAERAVVDGRSRSYIRALHRLRGEWHFKHGEWTQALASFRNAVSMARAVGLSDPTSETWLALSMYRNGQLEDAWQKTQELMEAEDADFLALAELWLALDADRKSTRL